MSALLTEPLEQRLARLIPGARIIATTALGPNKTWSVVCGDDRLASGPTKRDVADKALMLFGSQR